MKEKKIVPRGQWILIQPKDPETKNEHGLIIPDSVEKDKKAIGTVIRVGKKVEDLKAGQEVIFGVFAGEPIQLGSKAMEKDRVDYLLILDEDIIGILE